MLKRGSTTTMSTAVPSSRVLCRRAQRLMRRGEPRKALQMLRENVALEPSGATYCWLATGLLRTGKAEEALHALRQALYCFRYEALRGRARTVARWILQLDPADGAARKVEARTQPGRLRPAQPSW